MADAIHLGPLNNLNLVNRQPNNLILLYAGVKQVIFQSRFYDIPAIVPIKDPENNWHLVGFIEDSDTPGVDLTQEGPNGLDLLPVKEDTGYDIRLIVDDTFENIAGLATEHDTPPTIPAGYPYVSPPLRYICCNVYATDTTYSDILFFRDMGGGLTLYDCERDYIQIMSDDPTTAREAVPFRTHPIARKAQCPKSWGGAMADDHVSAIGAKIRIVAKNDHSTSGDFGIYCSAGVTNPFWEEINIGAGVQAETKRRNLTVDVPFTGDEDTSLYKEWTDSPGDPKVDAFFLGYWQRYY